MAIPEIVPNVLFFTDRPTLRACLRVSRLWNACAKPLFWRTHPLRLLQLFYLFDAKNYNFVDKNKGTMSSDNRMRHFIKHCHHIQSLVISDPMPPPFPPSSLLLISQARGLRNLIHLTIQLPQPGRDRVNGPTFYDTIGAVISLNPKIRKLEWKTGSRVVGRSLINSVLKRTTRRLKTLTIYGDLCVVVYEILGYLIEASETQREDQQQKKQEDKSAVDTAKETSTKYVGDGDVSDGGDDGQGCCELEELVLQYTSANSCYHTEHAGQLWTRLQELPGVLPIRSLALVEYETRLHLPSNVTNYSASSATPSLHRSLLNFLSKCPQLEKLCVTFDTAPYFTDSSSPSSTTMATTKGFSSQLENHRRYSKWPSNTHLWEVQGDFVQQMYQSCPELVEIEFGMAYQFKSGHWIEMMTTYGRQLESLSIWGNVLQFDEDAFCALIGPPAAHLSRNGVPSRLTRLNFNGMKHLCECLWIAFRQLPFLKEFRARDVGLDARDLIAKDGWICKELEVLEISIAVPDSILAQRQTWTWCNTDEHWTFSDEAAPECECYGCKKAEEHRSPSEEDNGIHGHWNGNYKENGWCEEKTIPSKRQLEQPIAQASSQKKTRTDAAGMEVQEANNNQESGEESLTDVERLSIQVCDMLGRLTRLRELRIEGGWSTSGSRFGWTCLELSLRTGLDRLAPLRQSLETLDVSFLDHELCGKEEVEWIARNWIHHYNPRWLRQYPSTSTEPSPSSTSSSMISPVIKEERENELRDEVGHDCDDYVYSCSTPRFKELLGMMSSTANAPVKVERAKASIKWLQEQCPTLAFSRATDA
ncbi:hypothetical protein B0O80DRAFT_502656 [Mortierella sp. GBAus27b]|nr:hypothetical protein BGX31_010073 [Mortierella sp. GBA43]KAI8347543.1 hypothetical protein B0O80DRAFT_502656 [Mortierella sp. GBAus27b]